MKASRTTRHLAPMLSGVIALLLLWATRLPALELLPLHNDEGLHLTRAVEVWNGHPFWAISDGKIINHWLIAVFYPQNAPVFAGRFATLLVSLIGLAAAYRLARPIAGPVGALLAAALWIACPYLFTYEWLAFSDAQAGALVVLAMLASWRLAQGGTWRLTVFTGLAFGAAALFKFTAAPFLLSIALIVLFANSARPRRRLLQLATIIIVIGACFAAPLAYLLLRGSDLFAIALGWIGVSAGGGQPAFLANVERLVAQLTGFGPPAWALAAGIGLAALGFAGARHTRRETRLLALAGSLPLLTIMLLGREVLSRHYVVTLPPLLTLGGIGLGLTVRRLSARHARWLTAAAITLILAVGAAPALLAGCTNPADQPLPPDARYELITSHSSGYALREALRDFPRTIARRDLSIIGSMFPDSCRRANFYALPGLALVCADAPGLPQIQAALAQRGAVYVLADNTPNIGIDVSTLDVTATRVAAYARPGQAAGAQSVVLWLLEAPNTPAQAAAVTDCAPQTLAALNIGLPPYTPSALTGFARLNNDQLWVNDTVYPIRGVNYYPARFPWRRFLTQADLDTVRAELDILRAAGFNTLRIFLWNEALFICLAAGAAPNAEAFQRLDAIIHLAAERDFRLIVTLNDLPDLTHTPLYTNPPHVVEQTRFIIQRYRDEAALLAWDLRNEGDIDYGSNSAGGGRFPRQQVLDWLGQTSALVRSLDGQHLITAGWLHDSAATAPYVDFISFHHWDDAARLVERTAAVRAETDKPILLQEVGYSTFRVSPQEQARLLFEVAHVAEAEGLLGWLVWTAFDFPLDATCIPPACPSQDNAEHHFGLYYSDYTPKPAAAVAAP